MENLLLIPQQAMDPFGFVTRTLRAISFVWKTRVTCMKPRCGEHDKLAKMCVVKDLMKVNYGRPFFVCGEKAKPCSFWMWGDVQPLAHFSHFASHFTSHFASHFSHFASHFCFAFFAFCFAFFAFCFAFFALWPD
jgi:hypothetical protein